MSRDLVRLLSSSGLLALLACPGGNSADAGSASHDRPLDTFADAATEAGHADRRADRGDADTSWHRDGPSGADDRSDSTTDSNLALDAASRDQRGDGSDRCAAASLGQRLGGRDRLLVGGSMSDPRFAEAPFDLRFQYLAGAVPGGGPCASCAQNCSVNGLSCDNGHGCEWWGCWQWDQEPPGRFVASFIDAAVQAAAIPMITYYVWRSVSAAAEGAPEVHALQDGPRVADLLADFRFLCGVVAEAAPAPVILHVEPDFWGYTNRVDDDPEAIPAAVSSAGDSACSGLDDSAAGFARCLVAIARAVAPNAVLALHASAWGAGDDAYAVTDESVDLVAHAQKTAAFMNALGAADTDLVVVEMSDRDAAFDGRWWDADNQNRPHFHQAQTWVAALGAALELPTLWWQVPYGHLGLDDVCDRYQDNRVDYFFDHPGEFAAIGSLGIAFGAGAPCMTTPDSDDGHFIQRATEYFEGARPPLCGE